MSLTPLLGSLSSGIVRRATRQPKRRIDRISTPTTAAAACVAWSPNTGNPVNFKNAQLIADFALRNRLPRSYDERGFVALRGLFSYGSSFIDTYRREATYADKISWVRNPLSCRSSSRRNSSSRSSKTANVLGLAIPHSLLLRAEEVIG